MKKFIFPFLLLFVSLLQAQQESATDIIRKANDLVNGRSNESVAAMTIVRPKWSRTVSMKSWSLGTDYYMILITGPAQDKGQVFLKRDQDMWNWMPNISRAIKIPPSMMGQNWMGSDFTNNDLVKANSIVEDYSHSILGRETVQGYDCYKIQLRPKPDAAVVWDKIIIWVAKDKYFMLQSEFYDEDGVLVSKEVQTDVKRFGDRELPSKMTMTPMLEKGKKTVLEFQQMSFNVNIKPDFFSQQNMKTLH